MSPCGPRLNVPPSDWMTVASCPTSTSVWNPAVNLAGSYGLSSTTASALSMKRFWRRSYSRPTMAVPPALWPEYEYDPAAYPVSLKPASAVSRWFTGGGGGSGCLAAVSAKQPDPPPPPVNHLETALAGFKLTGFAAGSFSYSGHSAGGTAIVGRLYDRLQNRFMLNALAVVLDKPYDPAKFTAGFHTEVLVGQDATVNQSDGGTFNLGPQGDIPHLYVTLNVPTASGNGLQFKVGRIPTLLGLEVIETYANPNWSEGNQFVYVENFTATGLSVETKFNNYVDLQLRVINGWDQVSDNNSHKSFMGRVGLYPNTG